MADSSGTPRAPGISLVDHSPSAAVAVFAHPDDAEAACGGTLARWAEAGAEVTIVVCTTGDKGSSDPAQDASELVDIRAKEARKSAHQLGAEGHIDLGYDDGELVADSNLRGRIAEVVRQLRPQRVVCPDPTAVIFGNHYVNHRDHREVGWATMDCVAHEVGRPIYHRGAGDPFQPTELWLAGTLEPDTYVDVTATIDRKAKALMCHQSQIDEPGEWLRTVVRERATEAGRTAGVKYAESFRRLTFTSSSEQ